MGAGAGAEPQRGRETIAGSSQMDASSSAVTWAARYRTRRSRRGRRFQQRSRCLTRGKRGGKGVIVPQHLLGHGGGKAVQPPGLRQRGAQGAPALAKLSGIFSDRRFHQLQQRGGYRLDEHFR